MTGRNLAMVVVLLVLGATTRRAWCAEAVTLENVTNPGPNKLDEPVAKEFSLERAVHFLDSAALTWQKDRQCFTCHTNYAYLYARPAVSAAGPAHAEVRKFAEELVTTRWVDKGPLWDAEVVATAAALAFNDAATTGKLHVQTRQALDRMWTLQRDDGGWALATLGDRQRADKGTQDTEHSDGYGTGFVVFVLRRAGTPASDARVQKAVAWLKANQRESGRWITRSLNKDNHHFISHAGTAFAVMALKACDGS